MGNRVYRHQSSDSLYQPPLAPSDVLRHAHNPYPPLPRAQSTGDNPAMLNMSAVDHQGHDTYTQNVLDQAPNYADHNFHAGDAGDHSNAGYYYDANYSYNPDVGYNPDTRDNPFADYNACALAVPTPDASAGGAMYDEDPFASHSHDRLTHFSTNSNASLHGNASIAPEEAMPPRAIASSRAIGANRESDATIQYHYEFYRRHI